VTARSATTAALLLTSGLLLLSGCTSTPEPTASPTPSASPSPATTATASPSDTPEPEPAPEPAPITCDAILTPEAIASLAEGGLELRAERAAGYPLAEQLAAAGGTACMWAREQGDVHVVAAQIAIAPGEEDAWARVLAENGYTQTDDPVPGAFTGPVDGGTGVSPVVLVEATRMSFVSVPTLVTDLAPLP
jgi:hypothetical protein